MPRAVGAGPGIRPVDDTGDASRTHVGGPQGRLVGATGEVEQVLAQPLGAAQVEEGQGERGVGPARGLHDHPGQPERPGEQRAGQLDGLHALEADLPVLTEEHALAQLDLAATDAEAGEAPADPVDQRDHAEEDHEHGEGPQGVGDRLLERVAATGVLDRRAVRRPG